MTERSESRNPAEDNLHCNYNEALCAAGIYGEVEGHPLTERVNDGDVRNKKTEETDKEGEAEGKEEEKEEEGEKERKIQHRLHSHR
ncbi:hypothetical protein HZH66_001388 [Vespula vulgaris]|uniref:Uncharacterized protein n=1 Tax=Vespula vulgaris TaxID=7454 RepID=A0A834KT90_VESVU|nr:hypothetical protein HZH66_001388 [Vespula vulgaris]